jgi:hypothetical protein
MVGAELDIVAVDPRTAEVAWRCPGPDARGACPRVAIGALIPCVGRALTVASADEEAYVVPPGMTLCPLTLAQAMGVHMGRSRRAA